MKNLKTYENFKKDIKIKIPTISSACKYLEVISPVEVEFRNSGIYHGEFIMLSCYLENVRYYNDMVKFFKENDLKIVPHDESYNSNKIQILVSFNKIKEYAELYDNLKKYNL